MEFQDVVRRRRMVRSYAETPVDPAVVDRALANATRAPSAGFSQGWGFLVLDQPGDVQALLGGDRRPERGRGPLAPGDERGPGRRHPVLEQGGVPRPLRRGRQGLAGPRRGQVAGAVLAHRRRHGEPADPPDGGRRGARRVLLRHPARPDPRGQGDVRDPRDRSTRSARSPSATRPTAEPRAHPAPGRASRSTTSFTAAAGASSLRAMDRSRRRSCRRWSGSRPSPTATGTRSTAPRSTASSRSSRRSSRCCTSTSS